MIAASGPLEVLVVDDNRIMRDMVVRSVAMSGLPIAQVRQAADGRQALDALRSVWTDLVLLDLNMPVMDGETFLRELRADTALRDRSCRPSPRARASSACAAWPPASCTSRSPPRPWSPRSSA
jgi:CheY-like chemotaxis protein